MQPTIKTGRKWKVVEAADQSKERFKMKEVIGQTQNDCKGLGPSVTKLWSEAEGKEKREMVINEIRLNEDSRGVKNAVLKSQQGQWTNWDNALQESVTWNDIWHICATSDQLSHQISVGVYDLLPSKANLLQLGLLCNGRQTMEHVLSTCKIALLQRCYTWRHKPVICCGHKHSIARGQSKYSDIHHRERLYVMA